MGKVDQTLFLLRQGRDILIVHVCVDDIVFGGSSNSLVARFVLGNLGKPVTVETLSLTKFSKHVFQEQGIRDSRKPGTCEASNSRMCRVRES
jgi:hypothetical protein